MKFNPNSNKQNPDDTRNIMTFVVVVLVLLIVFDSFIMQPKLEALKKAEDAKLQQQAEQMADKARSGDGKPGVSSGQDGGAPSEDIETVLKRDVRIPIRNDKLDGSLNLTGARLDDLRLSQYYKTLEKKEPVDLLTPRQSGRPYYTEFGWVPEDKDIKVPAPDTRWSVKGNVDNTNLTPDNPVTLVWDNGEGLKFERTIRLDENYLFTVEQVITNTTERELSFHPFALISRHGFPENGQGTWILHEGPIAYFNKELHQLSYKDLAKDEQPLRKQATDGWAGITDKYWMVSFLPDQVEQKTYRFVHKPAREIGEKPRFQVDMLAERHSIAPGESTKYINHVFAGAKKVDLLEQYERPFDVPHFDLAVDFGWFYFITKPFFSALSFLFNHVGNFGVAIVLFTVLLRLLVFPLANSSYKSFARLKQISPQIMEIRDTYQDDKQRLQQELVKLYEREKVNPLAGCLPILIQIPIFFSLYKVLFITIEMRHAPFFGWIQDLSAQDPTSLFNLFGLLPFGVPGFLQIGVWPCLMLVTLLVQQRLNPPPQDPMQRQMMMMFPFIITYVMSQFPAGLVVYWTVSAMLAILQQYVIMTRMGVEVHLFKRSKAEEKMDEMIAEGPDVHPGAEYAEEQFEEAFFGKDDEPPESGGDKPVSKPKPKKKRKR